MLGKYYSRCHSEILFLFFSQKIGSDISYKLSPKETICMKCLILFPGKSKKNILNLLSAEIARNMLSVKGLN